MLEGMCCYLRQHACCCCASCCCSCAGVLLVERPAVPPAAAAAAVAACLPALPCSYVLSLHSQAFRTSQVAARHGGRAIRVGGPGAGKWLLPLPLLSCTACIMHRCCLVGCCCRCDRTRRSAAGALLGEWPACSSSDAQQTAAAAALPTHRLSLFPSCAGAEGAGGVG